MKKISYDIEIFSQAVSEVTAFIKAFMSSLLVYMLIFREYTGKNCLEI